MVVNHATETHVNGSDNKRHYGAKKPSIAALSQEIDSMIHRMRGGLPAPQSHKLASSFHLTTPDDTLQETFNQLAHALTVLSSAADLMTANKQSQSNHQHLGAWLQPQARAAEEAMHRLRELHQGPSSALTELSQCLTILVLAADMLCAGQLSAADTHECYALLRRNAERAIAGLYEVHSHLASNAAF